MRLPAAVRDLRDLHGAIVFRWQWRWRIPATARLAAAYPELGRLTAAQLGILAGHLQRTRCRGPLPAELAGSYRIVRRTTFFHVRAAALRQLLDAG